MIDKRYGTNPTGNNSSSQSRHLKNDSKLQFCSVSLCISSMDKTLASKPLKISIIAEGWPFRPKYLKYDI